jgi:2-amino-4-hydroxy-6-hydroxymethyldihydropteridine diphosphokinase
MEAQPTANKAFLSLGTNMPNRETHLKECLINLSSNDITVTKKSGIYETESWGYRDSSYLNMCIEIETDLSAFELLTTAQTIEKQMGRAQKSIRAKDKVIYSARNIDIDILFFNREIIQTPELTVPHQKLQERMFVLKPLNEIASEFIHPVTDQRISDLYEACKDDLSVIKIN